MGEKNIATQAAYVGTRDVPIEALKPLAKNPRRGDVAAIEESVRRNGQYRALVVREDGDDLTILAGNHTYLALRRSGAETARCELVKCDDDTARRIVLADNRTAQLGTMDNETLIELLQSLDGEIAGTGFSADDMDKLLGVVHDESGDADTREAAMTWGVIVECDNEDQQVELLHRLGDDGWRVRAVMGG